MVLDLSWIPRDSNVEADALSNGNFVGFSLDRRVQVDPKAIRWEVLDRLMELSLDHFKSTGHQAPRNMLGEQRLEGPTSKRRRAAASHGMEW
jgi:hypothetical protein